MKKIVIVFVFCMAICSAAFAQSPLAEIEKVKQIKLLESTRDDVLKILGDYDLPFGFTRSTSSLSDRYEHFYTSNAIIRIEYSSGKCFEDLENEVWEDWNAPERTVTEVTISLKDMIEIKDIGIDYSKFRKERLWGSRKHDYAYHDKAAGIAIIATNEWINSIIFIPSAKYYSQLCGNPEIKKYYASKKWNRYPWLKKANIDIFPPANVRNLELSRSEITIDCDSFAAAQNKNCSGIEVIVDAVDPDNDVLTYDYYISGGKIVGRGAKVVWDLSGVKAGTYTITAVANDGCGPCGKFITRTIVVKEKQ